jgi:hypothetical protein
MADASKAFPNLTEQRIKEILIAAHMTQCQMLRYGTAVIAERLGVK